MEIWLRTLTGWITLFVDASDTIEAVKYRIQDILGTPVYQQRLVYKGRLLADGRTCSDYNMTYDRNWVQLNLRLCGGPPEQTWLSDSNFEPSAEPDITLAWRVPSLMFLCCRAIGIANLITIFAELS